MLEINTFEKTNFADGMVFNPEQIKINDHYYSKKTALLSRYGFGKGILVGYQSQLRVGLENSQLVLYPGAAIDEDGSLILVSRKKILLKDVNISQFRDNSTLYVYIRYKEDLLDQKDARGDGTQKHFYKLSESYSVELKERVMGNTDLFELARIFINQKTSNSITEAVNPYSPVDNEIDLRFSAKNFTAKSLMKHNEKMMISNILRKYADYLTELSYHKKSFTASIAATLANKMVMDVRLLSLSAEDIFELLQHLVQVSSKIENELAEIVNTGFWKNILRLQSLFSFSESCDVSYYDLLLNIESSFFSKVLLHLGNASIFDGNWNEINNDEDTTVKVQKGYLAVGCDPENDIIVEGEDIEALHAKLYPYKDGYFIEDVSRTSGIYINAERLESGVKKLIRHEDFTSLGKHGKILNLSNIKV